MTDGLRAHNLLKHLDWIKPILQLDFNYVKLVYERLTKSKPDHILLNYYDVPAADVAKIFPNQPSIVSWLVGVFQFNKPNCGKCVMVLDLLTTLSILTTGSITDKCKLLFTMYNINQTGLMDEGEHYNFIMRSSDCMKKLKFMGTLDMTSAEAKYVALEARVKHENNQITFIPGLYLPDFTRWVQTSKECQTLFRFVKVLNRLVDSMLALESRTNAVLHIMEAKHNYKLHAPNVPPLAAFPQCKASSVDVWLVFTNHACASVIIPLHRMGTTEVFVKCEKVVPLDSALYEVPRAILKRNADLHKRNRNPQLHCCDKHYLLTSYMRVPVDATLRLRYNVPYQRVDVMGLDSDSTYYLTVYTEMAQFSTMQVKTTADPSTRRLRANAAVPQRLPAASQTGSSETKSEMDNAADNSEESGDDEGSQLSSAHLAAPSQGKEGKRHIITILPATLSVRAAEALCAQRRGPALDDDGDSRAFIFTGTVCDVDQVVAHNFCAVAVVFVYPLLLHVDTGQRSVHC
jgi:hypothetical protein